jgi:ferrochelatase
VVLFQLGGPDSLNAIEPFLSNLFCDLDIIDFPFAPLAREPLAWLISSRRAGNFRQHYQEIGGNSPIGEVTARQVRALEAELSKAFVARVVLAMRYWHPLTEAAPSACWSCPSPSSPTTSRPSTKSTSKRVKWRKTSAFNDLKLWKA